MAIIKGSGQITLYDMNDIIPSNTEPTNPTEGMLWMDTSKAPYRILVYRTSLGRFEPTGATSLAQLDPEAAQIVEDAYRAITDLDADGKITRYERSVVRGEVANITGVYLSGTATMPTLAAVDANGLGELHTIRKESRDLGLPTNDATYIRLGNAYNALRTYLTGLDPRAWNIDVPETLEVDSPTWDAKWKEYYLSSNYLRITNNHRIQLYAEDEADKASVQARKDAIAAVSNALQHNSPVLTNPMTIDAPIATIALPEFEGKHVDGWEVDGRNILQLSHINTEALTTYSVDRTIIHSASGTTTMSVAYGTGLTLPAGQYTISFEKLVPAGSSDASSLRVSAGDVGGSLSTIAYRGRDIGGTGTFQQDTWTFSLPSTKSIGLQIYNHAFGADFDPEVTIKNIKIQTGSIVGTYTDAPEDVKPDGVPRIQPITQPIFRSGTSMTMQVKAYGDGTTNDLVEWDSFGNAVKIKHWEDVQLDGSHDWELHNPYAASNLHLVRLAFPGAVAQKETVVKYDGTIIPYSGPITATPDVYRLDEWTSASPSEELGMTISNADSGWGPSYRPTKDEVKVYFNGWRMCNGTHGNLYASSGTKTWYPIGDTDLSRSETTLPEGASVSIEEKTINYYQLVYRLKDPVQEILSFDGVLNLIQGVNNIEVSYPSGTPKIVTGKIKYATNLATATQDISYLIPVLQTRLSNAEEIITDDSIVNKVMNSVSYQVGLSSKANSEELSDYATSEEVGDLLEEVGDLSNAVSAIDLSPYITKSELDQTALQITAKFSATGGMNLVKNSIGFADLDFWDSIYGNKVDTIAKNELDILGFGSGFVFSDNGQEQGISQKVSVNPGQPYTLSWYLEKLTSGTTNAHRFWIQIMEGGVVRAQIADNSNETTDKYEAQHMVYIPESSEITVRFIGYANVEATLTGIMLTIGDIPLQWSLSTGELYNTHIRMDINGIRVSQFEGIDEQRQEVGYTAITPDEFAGYALIGGVFQKIFYLNGQETVTKKLRAEEEITMGTIKAQRVNSSGNNGWAFIKNSKTV